MKLTTNCTSCVFNNKGCLFDKKITRIDAIQHSTGFCRYKRIYSKSFLEKVDNPKQLVEDEQQKLDLILWTKENKWDDLVQYLEALTFKPNKIILITNNARFPKELIQIRQNLLSSKSNNWEISDLRTVLDNVKEDRIYHMGIPCLESKWCLLSNLNIKATKELYEKFIEKSKDIHSNHGVIYFDDMNLITDKSCFFQMNGNDEINIIHKMETFENSEEVCIKLQP